MRVILCSMRPHVHARGRHAFRDPEDLQADGAALPAGSEALVYISGAAEIGAVLGLMTRSTATARRLLADRDPSRDVSRHVHMALNPDDFPGVPGGASGAVGAPPVAGRVHRLGTRRDARAATGRVIACRRGRNGVSNRRKGRTQPNTGLIGPGPIQALPHKKANMSTPHLPQATMAMPE